MIAVIDYGVGNTGSVINMIKRAGGEAQSSGDPEVLRRASKLLLPGVGHFDHAMKKLHEYALPGVLRERALAGVPILGICLGMQLLAEGSEEGSEPGLGLIGGRVVRFAFAPGEGQKVPHMGWNTIRVAKLHPLVAGLDDASRFYFVHSYHYRCADPADELLSTQHGYRFTSGVQRDNVMGTQFHPEKSHRFGLQLIRNFVEM